MSVKEEQLPLSTLQ